MAVTEQRGEQPIHGTEVQSGIDVTPTTRQVRPSVVYLLGRPAESWVEALNRGSVTLAR
jgi:hypothetical protein